MSFNVLGGYGVELYLDGCVVYGSTEEEFLSNLRKVMDRFEKHNIILNPKKCKFVMSSIEYVGHIINQNGFHFGRDKLDEVLNFAMSVH